jgi:C-terminal processing protease CtpA/Prc
VYGIDVRDDGGGSLSTVDIAGLFMKRRSNCSKSNLQEEKRGSLR